MLEYFRTNKILQERIKDLERQVEILTGANQILGEQLGKAQLKEEILLNKIFDYTGVNKQFIPRPKIEGTLKSINRAGMPWSQTREILEREAYWEAQLKKNKEKNKDKEVPGVPGEESREKIEEQILEDAN